MTEPTAPGEAAPNTGEDIPPQSPSIPGPTYDNPNDDDLFADDEDDEAGDAGPDSGEAVMGDA
jgi:hypothetical protein